MRMDVKKGRMGRGKAKKDWKNYECGADELFQRFRVLIPLRTPVGLFFLWSNGGQNTESPTWLHLLSSFLSGLKWRESRKR